MNFRNRTFKIFNTTYKLKFVDNIESEDDNSTVLGTTDSSLKIIEIRTKGRLGKVINKNDLYITLLHEIIHAIFIEGQYLQANQDEPLVEWTAKCLKHLIDQKVLVGN